MPNPNVYFDLTKQISSHSVYPLCVYIYIRMRESIKHRRNESDEPLIVTYESSSPSLGNSKRDVYCVRQAIRTNTTKTVAV